MGDTELSIAGRLTQVRSTLLPDVTLVAVSKTKPLDLLREAYAAGQRDFGENYVQELVDKHSQLPADIRWHFIGHLQSNKVKYIAGFVHLIHGVDSLKLLREINKQGQKNKRVIDCLLQLYIAKEESKFGWDEAECRQFFESGELAELRHIRIVGLMGMASNTEDESRIQKEFEGLHQFFKEVNERYLPLSILSAGMSGDYVLAMNCGSNMVRIGSTIFGSRR
jgi:pyridoxal phosphate enzyme (YggS family)